ncbi:NTP transferase domain-containing protein [Candidatus Parcubacteria bacterium]|nr:NTP transferase domain-containing protein [Candidatus Parcubacteria bacterium]
MQAVILAAGKSTRTYPLTLTRPKPLLRVANVTIIEHNLQQLSDFVDEVIIVVGYRSEMIKKFLGDSFGKMKIKYVIQDEALGNADALKLVQKNVKNRFILMFGDDLYSRKDVKNLLIYDNAILAKKVKNPENFGVLKTKDGIFSEVVEKPTEFISDLVNIGCFVFSRKIFDVLEEITLSSRNEYELTDAYNLMAKTNEIQVVQVEDYWLPITYPWNLLEANEYIIKNSKSTKDKKAVIEKYTNISKNVSIGKNTIIKSGSYIEDGVVIGDNCEIGPNCYLRKFTTIGDNCHIGQAVEIKNSIIGDNSNIAHLSYVGDSVIGNNVNFGAGTVTANLRHDGNTIKSMINGNLVNSGKKKLGIFVGDKCKTGINNSFYPAVKIDPSSQTLPGAVVKKDVINN